MPAFAAVDLGASSARVMRAQVDHGQVDLREVHRVPNRPVTVDGTLHWDVLALWRAALNGLARAGDLDFIAVDGWAVDYALLDADGRLLGQPVHYRDARTHGVPEQVAQRIPAERLYARTGVQVLPINTVYQWYAARDTAAMQHATTALLLPDLIGYWLTGAATCERTNASTTGLLDPIAGVWASDVFDALRLRVDLLPAVQPPGTVVGTARCGAPGASVSLVGSHDTASAVAGVPADGRPFAYVSCGTWSLVGVELGTPILTPAAREANFTNELGVDGTVRFLRNVMGLWLLQEAVRVWERDETVALDALLAEAARLPGGVVIDVDRPEFLPPGDAPARIRAECRRTDRPEPSTPAEVVRCILDSLAAAYRRTIDDAARLSGVEPQVVHLVGGGARNALLCQLTADACERPVVAGPVEAAAYGNVLVQARTAGVVSGELADLRRLIPTETLRTYTPR